MTTRKHLYGPVPSRRLGLSLGVDIIPPKVCTLSCIYCQLGPTPRTCMTRDVYIPQDEIIAEVARAIDEGLDADWITFAGSGEPTLHVELGAMIRRVKELTGIPVCVITNGTMLGDAAVREDLACADAVLPSLDSAVEETFAAICRPHPDITVAGVIEGLRRFREGYAGLMHLEILFVAGRNDTPAELAALKAAMDSIRPDTIDLNTVARPPADAGAKAVSSRRLEEISAFFGPPSRIIASCAKSGDSQGGATSEAVMEYLRRRPASLDDLVTVSGVSSDELQKTLKHLALAGHVRSTVHNGIVFWEYTDGA